MAPTIERRVSPGVKKHWLPQGKRAAVCFTVDDVHPARSTHHYEAGGDLGAGALGRLEWLLGRHPDARATLFVTPDWREISPIPRPKVLARLPWIRDRFYLGGSWPEGTMRLDRHPEFVSYLAGLERTDVALHGLHHIHRGTQIAVEFQDQSRAECRRMLEKATNIFRAANLAFSSGMTPPAFHAPAALRQAMVDVGLTWISSARDIRVDIAPDVRSAMSGMKGLSLIHPEALPEGLVHIPVNFQATSTRERAFSIVEAGGILSIKAHIIKNCMGFIALDGVDQLYMNYLDSLFHELHSRWGDALLWTSMAEIDRLVRKADQEPS
ncbi:MAG: DUF2334 domain-containing protein [Polyangiaceae bacterium]|nr:DUF2334 domain-containing protein [Polyangiaceae bacterium]